MRVVPVWSSVADVDSVKKQQKNLLTTVDYSKIGNSYIHIS